MREVKEVNDFVFNDIDLNPSKLIGNVIVENFNSRKIEVVNVFEYNGNVIEAIKKINEEKDITFEEFSNKVKQALKYDYGARSEYEVIITSWPPYVDSEEIDRLVKERQERIDKWGNFYHTDVRLIVDEKIDVYSQIMLNYPQFIHYLGDNRELIKNLS